MFDKEHVGAFLWNGKGMICRACIPLSGREDEFLSDETVNVIAQAQERGILCLCKMNVFYKLVFVEESPMKEKSCQTR